MAYYAKTFGGLAAWIEQTREEQGARIYDMRQRVKQIDKHCGINVGLEPGGAQRRGRASSSGGGGGGGGGGGVGGGFGGGGASGSASFDGSYGGGGGGSSTRFQ